LSKIIYRPVLRIKTEEDVGGSHLGLV